MSNGLDREKAARGAPTEELVRRVQRGDAAAFDGIVAEYQHRIFNMAYRMLNHYEEAADITQEIFVQAYRSIAGYRGDSSFSTWLHAVAANMCRNRIRRLRRLSVFSAIPVEETADPDADMPAVQAVAADPSPSETAERNEVRRILLECLAELPEEFGTVVVMRDVQGLTYEEIVAALGCSMGTVKSRLSRGRMMVKDKMRRLL